MLFPLSQRIQPGALFDLENVQYTEWLFMEDTVPKGGQSLGITNVSSLGHFYLYQITGDFSTLKDDGAAAAQDDGVSHLRGKFIDGGNDKALFNTYIPLDLWCTPGRVKDAQDITGANSNNLFEPLRFIYMFPANSDIQLDVKNDSDWPNSYRLCFHGVRVLSATAVAGV